MNLQFKTVRKNEDKSFLQELDETVSRGTPETRASRLNIETSWSVLAFYQSRKNGETIDDVLRQVAQAAS